SLGGCRVPGSRVLDVNQAAADMEKMLRRLIGEDVDLVTDLGAEVSPVLADPGQMEQVLLNLAVNARDAMPHGGRLTISTRDAAFGAEEGEREQGRYVCLAVADTGVGIA